MVELFAQKPSLLKTDQLLFEHSLELSFKFCMCQIESTDSETHSLSESSIINVGPAAIGFLFSGSLHYTLY